MNRQPPLGQQPLHGIVALAVFLLAVLSSAAQAQEKTETPQWAKDIAEEVRADFASRLDAIEADITREIAADGSVVSTNLEWYGDAIPYHEGTGYYSPAPFDSTLDIMLAGSLPEARSQYAAALNANRWTDGIAIVGIDQNGQSIEIATLGGRAFPVLSYTSVEEIGRTQADILAEEMLVEHLNKLDPSGGLLAQCREIERDWFTLMKGDTGDGPQEFTVTSNKTMLCSTTGGGRSRGALLGNRGGGCKPCKLQGIPTAPPGTAYGYRPARTRGGFLQLFRPRSSEVSYINGQQNLQVFKRLNLGPQRLFTGNLSNPHYCDCNMGILMGARGMIRGDWRPRVIRQDQNYRDMGIFKKLAAHAFPRRVGMNNCLDCQTIQGLAGRRLMIAISLSTGLSGGNNTPTPTPPTPTPSPMPMPSPGMPMMMPGID